MSRGPAVPVVATPMVRCIPGIMVEHLAQPRRDAFHEPCIKIKMNEDVVHFVE